MDHQVRVLRLVADSGAAGEASEQLEVRLGAAFAPAYLDGVHDDLKTLDGKAPPLPQTVAVQVPRKKKKHGEKNSTPGVSAETSKTVRRCPHITPRIAQNKEKKKS